MKHLRVLSRRERVPRAGSIDDLLYTMNAIISVGSNIMSLMVSLYNIAEEKLGLGGGGEAA